MIRRFVAALSLVVLALAGCGSGNSGLPAGTHCGHSTNGVICVDVLTNQDAVGDVIGYYSPATSLAGMTWRLELRRYDCDPADINCQPTAEFPARARRDPPPVDGSCVTVLYDSGHRQCTTRLAQAMATRGDWAHLPALPSTTLAAHAWLCVMAQVAHGAAWEDQFARTAACFHHS